MVAIGLKFNVNFNHLSLSAIIIIDSKVVVYWNGMEHYLHNNMHAH